MCVSGVTMTGLTTVAVSSVTLWQQIILFILMCTGNIIVVSIVTVLIRRYWFAKTFMKELGRSQTLRRRLADVEVSGHEEKKKERVWFGQEGAKRPKLRTDMIRRMNEPAVQVNPAGERTTMVSEEKQGPEIQGIHLQLEDNPGILQNAGTTLSNEVSQPLPVDDEIENSEARTANHPVSRNALHRTMTQHKNEGLGGFPSAWDWLKMLINMGRKDDQYKQDVQHAPYLTFQAEVSRNSHFHNLSTAQKSELGGIEYRALKLLSWFVPGYWLFWVLFFIVMTAPYLASDAGKQYRDEVNFSNTKPPHSSTWLWIFQCVSGITNTGMSLADNSMQQPLGKSYMMLLPTMWLILIGNTAFPVMLRVVIWIFSNIVPKTSQIYETLRFLLDHPRRCYIYLFPTQMTIVLFGIVFLLTVSDWFFAMILDLPLRYQWPSTGTWIADCLFQAVATRTAGFQTFDIKQLAPAEQLYQVIMMYVAAFPLALAVRSSNVYEEQTLCLYGKKPSAADLEAQHGFGRFLSAHVRNQLMYDMWFLGLAVFLISICEKGRIEDNHDYAYFQVFSIIFEVTSAYGTVGLSIGATQKSSSLAGVCTTLSKLVIIAVMLRGRHRALPYAIDRAVMLPEMIHEHDSIHDMHVRTSSIPPRTISMPVQRVSTIQTNTSMRGARTRRKSQT